MKALLMIFFHMTGSYPGNKEVIEFRKSFRESGTGIN